MSKLYNIEFEPTFILKIMKCKSEPIIIPSAIKDQNQQNI